MIGDAQKWKKNPKSARVFSAFYHFSSHTTTAQSNVNHKGGCVGMVKTDRKKHIMGIT